MFSPCVSRASLALAGILSLLASPASAFAPAGIVRLSSPRSQSILAGVGGGARKMMPLRRQGQSGGLRMVTPEAAEALQAAVTTGQALGDSGAALHMAFADQGGNLAGKFFQASLLPYLGFLFFLKNKGKNAVPETSFFGFQFLLLFVLATIPTGIISKTAYGVSLADVDWLHGSAEALLTVTNLLIVFGFRDAMKTGEPSKDFSTLRYGALACAGLVAATAASGIPAFGFEAHVPFLAGIGNLPADAVASIPFLHPEPENALSLPTWAIHFSSVFEWIFAMGLVWDYAEASKNEAWKGLTWGMLPLHASGVAACTYHFFYNSPDLAWLVALQAGLTLLGNTTVAIAAVRIALSNGWDFKSSLPFQGAEAKGEAVAAPMPTVTASAARAQESEGLLLGKLSVATLVGAYAMKYGELALPFPFEPNSLLALAMVATPPAILAKYYSDRSSEASSGTEAA